MDTIDALVRFCCQRKCLMDACLNLLEGLWTHTLCLSWQIADFNRKREAITAQRFITMNGALVVRNDDTFQARKQIVSRTRNVLWYASKGCSAGCGVYTLYWSFAEYDVCHPGCGQVVDQCVWEEYTMMSGRKRLEKDLARFGLGWIPIGSEGTL